MVLLLIGVLAHTIFDRCMDLNRLQDYLLIFRHFHFIVCIAVFLIKLLLNRAFPLLQKDIWLKSLLPGGVLIVLNA